MTWSSKTSWSESGTWISSQFRTLISAASTRPREARTPVSSGSMKIIKFYTESQVIRCWLMRSMMLEPSLQETSQRSTIRCRLLVEGALLTLPETRVSMYKARGKRDVRGRKSLNRNSSQMTSSSTEFVRESRLEEPVEFSTWASHSKLWMMMALAPSTTRSSSRR